MKISQLPFSPPSLNDKNIELRPVNPGDYKLLFEWHSDTANLHLWWVDRKIMSFDEFADDFRHRLGKIIQTCLIIQTNDKDTQESAGMIYNYNTNFVDQYTYLCIYLRPQFMVRGVGLQAWLLFIEYLFSYFNFRKIYGEIFGYNQLSLKSALHSGFIEEGCLKNHRWFGNQYWDLHILSLSREQFDITKEKFVSRRAEITR